MELLFYWRIVRRRFWLILFLLLVLLLSHWLAKPELPTSYVASMRFVIGLRPEPRSGEYFTYDRYYTWLTAEYLVDDLAEVVKSRAFAQDVARLVNTIDAPSTGLDIAPGVIQGMTSAGKLHRILNVSVTWHDRSVLERIANAGADILRTRSEDYFAQLSTETAVISLIDPPSIAIVGPSLRQRLDLPLRLILALGAGIALAFLLDYLDTSIRDRADLEKLDVPLLAEIPTRLWWRRNKRQP